MKRVPVPARIAFPALLSLSPGRPGRGDGDPRGHLITAPRSSQSLNAAGCPPAQPRCPLFSGVGNPHTRAFIQSTHDDAMTSSNRQ